MSEKPTPKPTANSQFEQLLAEEQADKTRQNKKLREAKNGSPKSVKIAAIAAGSVIALIVGTLVVYDPFTGALRFGGDDSKQVEAGENPVAAPVGAPEWWKEPANVYPVELENWQKTKFDSSDSTKSLGSVEDQVRSTYSGSAVYSAATTFLPAESTGYTTDLDAEVLEDGSLNPMFSYWTQELYVAEFGSMLERLINPTYGNWESDGYNGRLTDVSYNALKDLFSAPWVAENTNSSSLPLYVSGDTSIEHLPEGGSRWVGEPANVVTDFSYDTSIRNYRVQVTADIVYTTWTATQEKKTANATLELSLVPNVDQYTNGSANRVVIDYATIEVK